MSITLFNGRDSEAEDLLSHVSAMKSERNGNENFYLKASKIFDPMVAARWCGNSKERQKLGSNAHVFTSVGTKAVERNTNFFLSNATPANGSWWGISRADGEVMDHSMAEWANNATRLAQAEQSKTLYIALGRAFRNMQVSYGVIHQGIRRDYGKATSEIVYQSVDPWSFWFRKNIYGDIAMAVHYKNMSVFQYHEEYGHWPEGYKSEKERKNRRNQMVCVAIIVKQNRDKKGDTIYADLRKYDFVEYHVVEKEKRVIDRRGYHVMPFYVFGMLDVPTSDYPIGYTYNALPDALMANAARAAQATAFAYLHKPPILTNLRDATSRYGKSLRPGAMIEGGLDDEGKPAITPLNGLFNPEVMSYAVADDEARVNSTLWQNDLISNQPKDITATQATLIAQERAALVAPFINNIMPSLVRMNENHIRLDVELGNIQPYADTDLEIDITSPMAKQALVYDLSALNEALSYLSDFAQVAPEILAAVDAETIVKEVAQGTGTEHVFNADNIAKVKREQQQMQQQAQAQIAQAQQAETIDKEASAIQKVAGAINGR